MSDSEPPLSNEFSEPDNAAIRDAGPRIPVRKAKGSKEDGISTSWVARTFGFLMFNILQTAWFHTAYRSTKNMVVIAATGLGKTAVYGLRMNAVLKRPLGNVLYITPTRALSKAKKAEFQRFYAERGYECLFVNGETTYEQLKAASGARVVCATVEKIVELLSRAHTSRQKLELLRDFRLIVIDECHFIGTSRGWAFETLLACFQMVVPFIQLIVGSGTIPFENIQDFKELMGSKSELKVHGEEFKTQPVVMKAWGYEWPAIYTKPDDEMSPEEIRDRDFHQDNLMNYHLYHGWKSYGQNKACICFVNTKAGATRAANQFIKSMKEAIKEETLARNNELAKEGLPVPVTPKLRWMIQYDARMEDISDKDLLRMVIDHNVATHHGNMSIKDRTIIEALYQENMMCFLAATSGMAVGMDTPAHLVISKHRRIFHKHHTSKVPVMDLLQEAGRAGRVGKDSEGGVCLFLCHRSEVEEYEKLSAADCPVFESSLKDKLPSWFLARAAEGFATTKAQAYTLFSFTFIKIRARRNPTFYGLADGEDPEVLVDKALETLQEAQLVEISEGTEEIRLTELGNIVYRDTRWCGLDFDSIVNFKDPDLDCREDPEEEMAAMLRAAVKYPALIQEKEEEWEKEERALLQKCKTKKDLVWPWTGGFAKASNGECQAAFIALSLNPHTISNKDLDKQFGEMREARSLRASYKVIRQLCSHLFSRHLTEYGDNARIANAALNMAVTCAAKCFQDINATNKRRALLGMGIDIETVDQLEKGYLENKGRELVTPHDLRHLTNIFLEHIGLEEAAVKQMMTADDDGDYLLTLHIHCRLRNKDILKKLGGKMKWENLTVLATTNDKKTTAEGVVVPLVSLQRKDLIKELVLSIPTKDEQHLAPVRLYVGVQERCGSWWSLELHTPEAKGARHGYSDDSAKPGYENPLEEVSDDEEGGAGNAADAERRRLQRDADNADDDEDASEADGDN